jgi:hypothetical protein
MDLRRIRLFLAVAEEKAAEVDGDVDGDDFPPAPPDPRIADQIGLPALLLVLELELLEVRSTPFGRTEGDGGDNGGNSGVPATTAALGPEDEDEDEEAASPAPPPLPLCPCRFFSGDTRIDDCNCKLDTLALSAELLTSAPDPPVWPL